MQWAVADNPLREDRKQGAMALVCHPRMPTGEVLTCHGSDTAVHKALGVKAASEQMKCSTAESSVRTEIHAETK